MVIIGFAAGVLACNCYVVAPRRGGPAVVIDPGQGAWSRVRRIVQENQFQPVGVLLTHGHGDHMWSAQKVADAYGCPVYIHREDRHMLSDPLHGLGFGIAGRAAQLAVQLAVKLVSREPQCVVELDRDADELDLGGVRVRVTHTPGHTRGSVVFWMTDSDSGDTLAFTGDTLFKQSVGRTDLPGGSGNALLTSLVSKVLVADDDTVVFPGHGESTTVGCERRTNPFVQGLIA